MEAIRVRGLNKRYAPTSRRGEEARPIVALAGIDLDVAEGEMFALLGPNGAGKSTLFSILATLMAPSSGTATVLGHDVMRERETIRQEIGIVFQEPALDEKLSAQENLELIGLLYGLTPRKAKRRARETLAELGLEAVTHRSPRRMSGGQKRRLELARALIPEPRLLFLDEATLGLDVNSRHAFWAEVRARLCAGRTVFFTTHYMEEADVADRVALMEGGRLLALGTPVALKSRLAGGRIILRTADDAEAQRWLQEREFVVQSGPEGLVLSASEPEALLPELLRALPLRVLRVEIREPSLEDVYLEFTGKGLTPETSDADAPP